MPATKLAPAPFRQAAATKLAYIDALRGLAILAVLLIHTEFLAPAGTHNIPAVLSALIGAGGRGVQLFFVASAFTMFYSLSHRRGAERNPTLNFFLRRFFRIAPLYWLGIAGYALYYYFVQARTFSLANIVAEFLFVHGLSPWWINTLQPGGWSITVEMCFYLLVPLLFTWIRSLNRAVAFLLACLLLNMVLQVVLGHWPLVDMQATYDGQPGSYYWPTFLFTFLPSQLPVFALGFVFYFLTTSQPRTVHPLLLLLGAGLLTFDMAMEPLSSLGLDLHHLQDRLIGPHIFSAVGFVLLAYALHLRPYRLLVNPITRYFGTLSFSLYLGHFIVIFLLNQFELANLIGSFNTLDALANFSLRFVLVLCGSVPLAYVLHHVVEVPSQQLGKKIIAKLEA